MQATAAISYTAESFDTGTERLMGRQAAGEGFLEAMALHASDAPLYCFANGDAEFRLFDRQVAAVRNAAARTVHVSRTEPARLAKPGCLFVPSPLLSAPAFERRAIGATHYSLCGVTHTVASHRIMDALGDYLIAPLEPWDALICTSRCVKAVVRSLIDAQADYLAERLGARPALPIELPIIPLGVECDRFARGADTPAIRTAWRNRLGIAEADIAVLYFGRLSYHAKANPAPMFLGLEAAASAAPRGARVHLILAGWFANETLERGFRDAAAALCPSVALKIVDGRTREARFGLWHAAELFASFSDNIQETFGLTPIEAMAAGLPVVVSDWDGYRDTVIEGETGFMVPALSAPAGAGAEIAQRHAAGIDSYDRYIGNASLCTAVDVRAASAAFTRLIGDPDLRRTMGEAASAHARHQFDWRVIIDAYRALWVELAERRLAAPATASRGHASPLRPDPFALFESFPSAALSPHHRIRWTDGLAVPAALQRLNLAIASYAPHLFLAPVPRAALCEAIRRAGVVELRALERPRTADEAQVNRTILWLAKFGVVAIEDPDAGSPG